MHLPNLLLTLEHKGVELFVKNGSLGFKGPQGAVTEALLSEIRSYREELVSLFERVAIHIENNLSPDRSVNELPLTPWHGWYLETFNPLEHKWYITNQIHIGEEVNFDLLKKAVDLTMNRYDTFRQRLRQRQDEKWALRMLPVPGDPKLVLYDVTEDPEKHLASILKDIGQTLNIVDGPVIYIALCKNRKIGDGIIISLHHTLVDGYSASVVTTAIIDTYKMLSMHQTICHETEIESSYENYTKKLNVYMNGAMFFARSLSYWDNFLTASFPKIPVDFLNGQHLVRNSKKVALYVGEDILSSKNRVLINDSLLIATAAAIANWSGNSLITIDVENHGRGGQIPGFDCFDVIGPTTFKFPLSFEIEPDCLTSPELFNALRERIRDVTPYGLGYGFLRYLQPDRTIRSEFEKMQRPQVFFNNRTTIFNKNGRNAKAGAAPLGESRVFKVDARGDLESDSPFSHDLVVECDSFLDGIIIYLTYSEEIHRDETIVQLAEKLLSNLRQIYRY